MSATLTPPPQDTDTLAAARDWLRAQASGGGANCPCCTQFTKVYHRKLNSGMARSLIRMWRAGGLEFVHLPTQVGAQSREEGKMRYWGLVVEMNVERPDGGHAGWWRVTELGRDFVLNRATVPSHVYIFDKRLLSIDGRVQLNIVEALGKHFDYRELMGE